MSGRMLSSFTLSCGAEMDATYMGTWDRAKAVLRRALVERGKPGARHYPCAHSTYRMSPADVSAHCLLTDAAVKR